MAKEKCGCRPIVGILSIILMTAGLYFLVWGFMSQIGNYLSWSSWNWTALLYYLIGVVLVGFGKMAHRKGYCECKIH